MFTYHLSPLMSEESEVTRSQLIFSLCARRRIRVKEKLSLLDVTIYSSDISGKTPL